MISDLLNEFSEDALRTLFILIQDRCIKFSDSGPGVLLRHDIDDDIDKAVKIADLEAEYGVQATFFILNTAAYWKQSDLMDKLRYMQNQGHEIAWHNNVLTEWIGTKGTLKPLIEAPLVRMRDAGLIVKGSASHGDPQCRRFGYLNYDVFEECSRAGNGITFPNMMNHPRVKMADYGLGWEAYHVGQDMYVSESGGKQWMAIAELPCTMPTEADFKNIPRIQILIHPQWWKI